MDPFLAPDLLANNKGVWAPYSIFQRQEWASFRANTPLTLTQEDVNALRSSDDPVDVREVETIYLALSRLLKAHFENSQDIFRQRQNFFQKTLKKAPFIIGIAGSVAVGKSTTARLLQALLSNWSTKPKVDLVTTDGFLYPNAKLERLQKMHRKGFPDSYDLNAMLSFLSKIKAGARHIKAPRYSHMVYNVLANDYQEIDQPDILLFEGLNVLQVHGCYKKNPAVFVSDFFDFSIYIDAHSIDIEKWYLERFQRLRSTAFRDKASFFHRYAIMEEEAALSIAQNLWHKINLKNLRENIEPTKLRANLILHKDARHLVDYVALRCI